jgi:hypothetical protein
VPLPETIPVRYTEEDAGYVTVRPVVRQTFLLDNLLDMILSVAGKDAARVKKLLQAGTVVYHFYRYSWAGFEASDAEIGVALAKFPDADPSRPFAPAACARAIFESGGVNPRRLLELTREAGARRRFLRSLSFWQHLVETAKNEQPAYLEYSYAERADVYRLTLDTRLLNALDRAASRMAPHKLRLALCVLPNTARILLICPR